MKQITSAMTINNVRLEPNRDGHSTFTFYEAPAGQPRAVRGWFYPGDTWGQEFIYPKKEAPLIASYKHNATVKTEGKAAVAPPPAPEVAEAPAPAPEPAIVAEEKEEEARVEASEQTPPPIETQSQQDTVLLAQNQPPAPVATPEQPAELPKTASNTPLVAMIGILSLFAACGFALLRSRA
jgi:LPXTG-motif cell wall-anchored protein